jgi:cytochrome P450
MPEPTVSLDADFLADPHAAYEVFRTQQPIFTVRMPRDGRKAWIVTRYDHARACLTDYRLVKNQVQNSTFDPQANQFAPHMLAADPPDHTRLRKLITQAFTARAIAALQQKISQYSKDLIERIPTSGGFDLMADYALQLPVLVICDILGVPLADREDFIRWTRVLVENDPTEINDALTQFHAYLTALVSTTKENPGDNILSGLVRAKQEHDSLSEQELISTAMLLLIAGHETTVNLIGNGMLALLQHPDQWRVLRGDPTLVPQAVEEFLRYDGPVHLSTFRTAAEPFSLGGVDIQTGDLVLVSLLAANRDEARFPNPHDFDVTRKPTGHVAFGHGIHHCVGAPLARMEAQTAFHDLLAAFPSLSLDAPPQSLRWRDSTLVHGVHALPVRFA